MESPEHYDNPCVAMAVIHVANLDTLAGRGTWPLKVQDKAEPEISAWCSSTVV